jgi:hypothetical protein
MQPVLSEVLAAMLLCQFNPPLRMQHQRLILSLEAACPMPQR